MTLINSSSLSANPPPVPPSVKAGLKTTGYPIRLAIFKPFSIVEAVSEGSTGSPNSSQSFLNSSRSSACLIDFVFVPNNSTRHSDKIPFSSSCTAKFKPVWPPIFGSIASGRSYLIIFAINSSVSGSM